jgi:nicotinate phosphoribosyltransferase
MDERIITSLADTDLYKITMQQAALHHYPALQTTWLYDCRNPGVDLRPILPEIREQIAHVAALQYTEEELRFLSGLSYIKPDFIDFLRIFRMNPDAVEIRETGEKVDIRVHGTWCHRGKWEIYILSIISEIYNRRTYPDPNYEEGRRRLREKVAMVKEFLRRNPSIIFRLIEFGTRRRFSKAWQEEVLGFLMESLPECLVGTSNVDMARRFGLRPFGTFAHEWLQAHQATGVRLVESQKLALDVWSREYRGELGIALTDVINMDAFLRDFDRYFAKLFDGARHDSGDPYEWTEKLLAHYRKLHIDPRTKYAVFSDSLDFPRALDLCARFEPQIMTSFGIGTNLTNDLGHTALNHVLKMIEVDGQAVAKISDAPGKKSICQDQVFLDYLMHVFEVSAKEVPAPTPEVGRPIGARLNQSPPDHR